MNDENVEINNDYYQEEKNDFPNEQQDNNLNQEEVKKQKPKISGLAKAGAILNIIGAIFFIFFFFWTIIILILAITTLILNIMYLSKGDHKVAAGVMGIICGSLIGGIFILVG